jgi:mono/diheme cytochrome c family protein
VQPFALANILAFLGSTKRGIMIRYSPSLYCLGVIAQKPILVQPARSEILGRQSRIEKPTRSRPTDPFSATEGPLLKFILITGLSATSAMASAPFTGGDAFIQKNCASCHSASAPAARLDLTKLTYEPGNPDNWAIWVKIHDRVAAGEMPPAPVPRPAVGSVNAFVNGLSATLTTYESGYSALGSAVF